MTLRVREIGFGKAAEPFIDVQWTVYRGDRHWTPTLRRVQRERLDPAKTPFLRYGEAQLFVAERDGRAVGRISAQVNPLHDEKWGERAGFFGFFDCTDDDEAAAALFAAAEGWLRARGAAFARGAAVVHDQSGGGLSGGGVRYAADDCDAARAGVVSAPD